MGVSNRDGRWLVNYFDENKKQRQKSFGSGDLAYQQALAFDKAVAATPKGKKLPNPEVIAHEVEQLVQQQVAHAERASKGMTFMELFEEYLRHIEASGRTPAHVINMRQIAKGQYYPQLGTMTYIREMTYPQHILPFIHHLQTTVSPLTHRMRSQTTINRYCHYLNAIFNYAMENEYIKNNPMKQWRKSKDKPRIVQLNLEDVAKIMEHAQPHVRWAIEVCFNLGTRPGESELLALKWDDVDFEKKEVRIYGRKTKKYRYVPVKDSFLDRLRFVRAKAKTEFIIEFRGKPIVNIHKAFKAACDRAGITYPVRLYDLRHLFATTMLVNGADLAAVSKLMGHSNVNMTANVYYQYLTGEKERAVSLLPELPAVAV